MVVTDEQGRHGMQDGPSRQLASWHTDPIVGVPRLRWWAGSHWTAWVVASPVELPSIAWQPELGELPAPICWGMAVLRVAAAPPLRIEARSADVTAPGAKAAEPAASPNVTRRHQPARRAFMVAAVVVIVACLAAGASVALLTGSASGGRHASPHSVESMAPPQLFGNGWW